MKSKIVMYPSENDSCLRAVPILKGHETTSGGRKPRILAADDNAVCRAVLKVFLEQSHYEVRLVNNGRSAMEALLEPDAPTIALLDWVMPDIDGPEVCRQIRTHEFAIEPYLIILSDKKEKTDVAFALDAGADEFLSKPFNMVEMCARLRVAERAILRQKRERQRVERPETAAGPARSSQEDGEDAPVEAPKEVESVKETPEAPERPLEFNPERIDALVLGVFSRAGLGDGQASPNLIGELTRVASYNVCSPLIQTSTG